MMFPQAAKQYAAKHALAYLLRNPSPPSNPPASAFNSTSGGVSLKPAVPPAAVPPAAVLPAAVPPAAVPPPAKSPKSSSSSVNIDSSSVALPPGDTGGVSLVPPSPSIEMMAKDDPLANPQSESITPDNAEFYSDRLPSVLEQVSQEANRLGFGCPKYEIESDPDKPGCFAGYPTFQNGGRIPPDMGHVTGAISKGLARELIADEVLKFFKSERERREDIIDSFKLDIS